jgi:Tol biopolymer transport system component
MLPAAAGAGGVPTVLVGSDMPSWSPDGERIAFVSFRKGDAGDLYTIRPDGRGERRLTATDTHEDMPRWSPDGSKIAFVRFTGGHALNFHLFVMNADGTEQRQVTHTGAANFAPTWSPDGTRLAFVTTRHGLNNPEIHAINVDGTGDTRLTNHPARDDSPAWSPDGSTIVFESNRTPDRSLKVYAMRPDGSDVRRFFVTDPVDFHDETQPAWSRDGRSLAFVTHRDPPDGNSEVYLVDADGRNGRRVTRNAVRDTFPTLSPDGTRIAVARGPFHRPELYVVAVEGTRPRARKITGVNLRFRRLTLSPRPPRSRDFFVAELVVRPAIDRFADIACYAAIEKDLLEPEVATVRRGGVHCAWHVPRSAKGKRLYGFAGARAGGTLVTRRFTLSVR